jgi:membrane protease YdiL (CAAX protease family)
MVKRHPMVAFFVLAYALSWWAWIPYAFGAFPNPIAGFGPFLAALAVLGLTEGRVGVVGLLRRMVRWRVGVGWYAVALLLPAAVAGLAATVNVVLGAEAPSAAALGRWTGIFGTLAFLLVVPGAGGAWEEPGWRGYAVPRLQSRWSALTAALVLGVLVAGWHLPLIVAGQVHYADVVSIMGATVVINWLFNHVRGSVLLIMLLHATNNAVSGSFFSPMFTGADSARQAWLLAALWCAVAVVVVLAGGTRDLSRSRPRQVEPDSTVAPVDPARPARMVAARREERP